MCARCEDLEEEVAWLKSELGIQRSRDAEHRLAAKWGLSDRESQVLFHLVQRKGETASTHAIWEQFYGDGSVDSDSKAIKVFVCYLRRKLPDGWIDTVWGRGFRLTSEALAECLAVIAAPQAPLAFRPAPRKPAFRVSGSLVETVLRRMALSPATYRDIAVVLPVGVRHRASALSAGLVKKGRAQRIAAKQPGTLSHWVATPEGLEYLAAIDERRIAA